MAGYDGYSKSNNALAAEAEGRYPLTAAITAMRKATGCTAKETRAALELEGPCEWHHTSSKYNRTNYYDVAAATERLRLVKIATSWPADWAERLDAEWPSSAALSLSERHAAVDALIARVAADLGTDGETLLSAYYAR